jgi:hypothetical protein
MSAEIGHQARSYLDEADLEPIEGFVDCPANVSIWLLMAALCVEHE